MGDLLPCPFCGGKPYMANVDMAVLASEMEPLGPDFEEVWDDNVDKLYISDEEP